MKKFTMYLMFGMVFVISSFLFKQSGVWKYDNMGQILGLGSVVVGYFVTRILLKSKNQA